MLPSILSFFGKKTAPPLLSLNTVNLNAAPADVDVYSLSREHAAAMIPVSIKPQWVRTAITPGSFCHLSGTIDVGHNDPKAVICRVQFLDRSGRLIDIPIPGLSRTEKAGNHFYAAVQNEKLHRFGRAFCAPGDAHAIEICLMVWRSAGIKGPITASETLRLTTSPARFLRIEPVDGPIPEPDDTLAKISNASEHGFELPIPSSETWASAAVKMHSNYTLAIRIVDTEDCSAECIVLRARFYDAADNLIAGRYDGMYYSEQAGAYRYLLRRQNEALVLESLSVPHGAARMEVCVQRWRNEAGLPRIAATMLLFIHGGFHTQAAPAKTVKTATPSDDIQSLVAAAVKKALGSAAKVPAKTMSPITVQKAAVLAKPAPKEPSAKSKAAATKKPVAGAAAKPPAAPPAANASKKRITTEKALVDILTLPSASVEQTQVGLTNRGLDIIPRILHGVTYTLEGKFEKHPGAVKGVPAVAIFSFDREGDIEEIKKVSGLSHSSRLGFYKYIKLGTEGDLSFALTFKIPKPIGLEKVTLRKWHPEARPVLNRQLRLSRQVPKNSVAADEIIPTPRPSISQKNIYRDRMGDYPLVPLDPETLKHYGEIFAADGADAVCRAIESSEGKSSRQIANDLVSAGQFLDASGKAGVQFALAERALRIHRSSTILVNYFWAAVQAKRVRQAYAACRELARLCDNSADEAEVLAFKQLQAHRVARLALLDLAVPVSVKPIESEPNRVCYVLHNSLPFSSGGYATRSQGIALGLQGAGYDVVTVSRPGFPLDMKPDMDPASVPLDAVIEGLRYVRVLKPLKQGSRVKPSEGGVRTDPYIVAAADALEAQFRALRPAVVMAASNYLTALPALIAARRLKLPFLYEVRGFWEITSMSRNAAYAETVEYMVEQLMETGVAEQADHVFTLTTPMREELVARGLPDTKLTLLPNSCDPTRFNPLIRDHVLAQQLNIPEGIPVIGYVGTFVDYEGLEDLAAACANLKREGLEFRLLLVGNENVSGGDMGPIMREITRIAEEAGFAHWLTMPGRIPHEDVERYYSLIDIAPFPRKPWPVCEMVSPMKPLEAMAMTKAVLVSNVRALTEMIKEDETGLSFEKGSVDSLTEKLRLLIQSPDLRHRLGQNGRLWVENERTWLATGMRAHDPIQHVLAEKARTGDHDAYLGGRHAAELHAYQRLLREATKQAPSREPLALVPGRSVYILHSSLPYLSGGYATRAHGVITGINAAGYDIRPYTRPSFPRDVHPTMLGNDYPVEDIVEGVAYRHLPAGFNRQMNAEFDYMLASIDAYRRVFEAERPSVVHGRSTYLISLPAFIAAKQLGLPFVYEVSGMWELVFAARDEDGKNKPLIDRITDLETFVIRHADGLITLTDDMRAELIQRGADERRIHMAPNSVDPDKFIPLACDADLKASLGIAHDMPVIGYVGSFVDYEGLDDLIVACAQLRDQGTQFRLLLVGDGLESKNLKKLVKEHKLEDIAILPGRVDHSQVMRYYSVIDVLVYARKPWDVCETVSPMKPFEALALEKTVLVSSVKALRTIIEDGSTGSVFEKGNIDSLAKKMQALIDSPADRAAYGRNGREWVKTHRSWRAVGDTITSAYNAAIQSSRSTP